MIRVISPASMYPEPVCKIKDKWKLSEDLFACSHSLCNVWRRKWYCLQWNNTGSIETEELWFYSSSVPSHKQLQAIDVFFVRLLLFDIRFRDTKRTLLKVSPHLGQAWCDDDPISSRSCHLHRAHCTFTVWMNWSIGMHRNSSSSLSQSSFLVWGLRHQECVFFPPWKNGRHSKFFKKSKLMQEIMFL